MKTLKTSTIIGRENGYLAMKSNSPSVKFHFVDNYEYHIDGYWLIEIGNTLRLISKVGTASSILKSNIDTDIYENNGRLKITGVDEL